MEQRFLPGMSPGLIRVAESARKIPKRKLLSLAHHIDVEALRRAFKRVRNDAAVGVDGVTKEAYGESLESNLQDLHGRLKTMRYRHQVIRRVYIEKEGGKQRPIGISCLEDKIVQDSLRELLEAVYEQDFPSLVTIDRSYSSAVAMIMRSNGSLCRSGNAAARKAIVLSMGASWMPCCSSACSTKISGVTGKRNRCRLERSAISRALIAETKRGLLVIAFFARSGSFL